jgi:hypothetical protein
VLLRRVEGEYRVASPRPRTTALRACAAVIVGVGGALESETRWAEQTPHWQRCDTVAGDKAETCARKQITR